MLVAYIVTSIALLTLDIIWLTVNRNTFGSLISSIQNKPVTMNIPVAALAYVAVLLSIFFIAVPLAQQAMEKKKLSVVHASLVYGGGVGFLIYAIYHFTNMAAFSKYSWNAALRDMLWGTTLYSLNTWLFLVLSSKR